MILIIAEKGDVPSLRLIHLLTKNKIFNIKKIIGHKTQNPKKNRLSISFL